MAYVGTPIDTQNQFQSLAGKRFSGDGSTTNFTLDIAPSSTLDIEVFVENVRQDPNSAYSLSGTTLAFSAAPPSGTNNIYVVHQAKAVGTISVPDDYKSNAQTISGARTFNGGITMGGTTPTLTIGDAGAEDTKIVFDGNAQDFHIGLDDSADSLLIGLGSTLGTTTYMTIDASGNFGFNRAATATDTNAFGAFISSTGEFNNAKDVGGSNNVSEFSGNAGQLRIRGDGDAENTNNSYGAISDRTLKENETSAKSQWDDIKALQIKNYNLIAYKDRPQLGVIAQDLESSGMNGLVKTDSEGLKSVKYSVLYMKAVKALQEAMIKIEDLETRVKALEG
tara:strand:+ start:13 stop:1023 length:1011 start_codon:yes stop_codon:yes gene_type:complete